MNTPSVQAASEVLPLLTASIIAYALFQTIALHIIFKKMGVLPFHAWIPIWSAIMFVKVAGVNMFLILLALVPFGANVVFVIAAHKMSPRLGFSGLSMTILAAVLPPVWFFIAAGARKPTPRDIKHGLVPSLAPPTPTAPAQEA